jgi:tetratricopeptide (TPR) repeat protein
MSNTSTRPAHQAFIARLRKLRRDCGNPSYAELRRLSQQSARPGLRLRVLTETTTQEILAGKRAGLPDWAWVAAFVEACRAAAAELALDPARLGTVDDWHHIWSAAHDTAHPTTPTEQASAPSGRGAAPPARDPLPPPPPPQPRPDDDPAEYDAEFGPAAERSQTLNRYLRSFGKLGGRLLIKAENNDPAAAYRIGVLLWCDGRRAEGLAWLEQATRAGISEAAALCAAPSQAAVAEAAYQLGQASDRDGDPAAALTYYQKAAKCGHAEAAYRTGAKLTDAGDPFTAGYWLDKAARLGHPDADRQFEDVYRRVRRGMDPLW